MGLDGMDWAGGREMERRLRPWARLWARLELGQEPKRNGNVDFPTLDDSCGAAREKRKHQD